MAVSLSRDRFREVRALVEIVPTNIVIIDAHPMIREGLRFSLNQHPLCTIVAEAGDIMGALFACANHDHDVIIISSGLIEGCAARQLDEFLETVDQSILIVCHLQNDVNELKRYWSMGVRGYLGQNAESSEYSAAVLAADAGGFYFSQDLINGMFERNSRQSSLSNEHGLTSREIEVLHLLTNGLCNKEIANQCNLSVRTVETHRFNIRRKTNSNTLSDLVRLAKSLR